MFVHLIYVIDVKPLNRIVVFGKKTIQYRPFDIWFYKIYVLFKWVNFKCIKINRSKYLMLQ